MSSHGHSRDLWAADTWSPTDSLGHYDRTSVPPRQRRDLRYFGIARSGSRQGHTSLCSFKRKLGKALRISIQAVGNPWPSCPRTMVTEGSRYYRPSTSGHPAPGRGLEAVSRNIEAPENLEHFLWTVPRKYAQDLFGERLWLKTERHRLATCKKFLSGASRHSPGTFRVPQKCLEHFP